MLLGIWKKLLILTCVLTGLLWNSQMSFSIPSDDFVIKVKTDNVGTSAMNQFTISTTGNGYNYDVDLKNMGLWEYRGITGNTTCVYAAPGTYTIRIRGAFPRIFFYDYGDQQKLISVEQWGTGAWSSMAYAFFGCSNLALNASDVPNLSSVTDMTGMFAASSVNQSINNWDTHNVQYMNGVFTDAHAFNQPLNNWNTSNVVAMTGMFWGASSFNQPTGNWDTSKVMNISNMFRDARTFNQPIGSWNTSNVEYMGETFSGATAFNQPLGNWNTSKVRVMRCLFADAKSFNQPIGNWDTSLVYDMDNMFAGASAFNQPIDNWNTANVTDMWQMFKGATGVPQKK